MSQQIATQAPEKDHFDVLFESLDPVGPEFSAVGKFSNNPVQEQHPEVSRFLIQNLASSPESAEAFLQKEGFEFEKIGAFNWALKKPGDTQWKVLDPKGFDLGDITDVLGGTAVLGGQVLGGIAGAGSGLLTGGATSLPGAAVGGAAGGAVVESLRQSLGQLVGFEGTNARKVVEEGVTGALAPVLGRVASKIGKMVVGKKVGAITSKEMQRAFTAGQLRSAERGGAEQLTRVGRIPEITPAGETTTTGVVEGLSAAVRQPFGPRAPGGRFGAIGPETLRAATPGAPVQGGVQQTVQQLGAQLPQAGLGPVTNITTETLGPRIAGQVVGPVEGAIGGAVSRGGARLDSFLPRFLQGPIKGVTDITAAGLRGAGQNVRKNIQRLRGIARLPDKPENRSIKRLAETALAKAAVGDVQGVNAALFILLSNPIAQKVLSKKK